MKIRKAVLLFFLYYSLIILGLAAFVTLTNYDDATYLVCIVSVMILAIILGMRRWRMKRYARKRVIRSSVIGVSIHVILGILSLEFLGINHVLSSVIIAIFLPGYLLSYGIAGVIYFVQKSHTNEHSLLRKMKRLGMAVLFQSILYVLQYLFLPLFLYVGPDQVAWSNLILILTTVILSMVGMYCFVYNFLYWMMALPSYLLLLNWYHPEYIYGIDYQHSLFASLTSPSTMSVTALVLVLEFLTWLAITLNRLLLKRLRKKELSKG